MTLLRIRIRNAFDAIAATVGGGYWNNPAFHVEDVREIDGEEVSTSPLLFSPVERFAFWNCVFAVSNLLIVFIPGSMAIAVMVLYSDSIPPAVGFLGLLSMLCMALALFVSLKLAMDGIRWTQLLATMDADGVLDDVFDNGPGIGAENDVEEDEEDEDEQEPAEEPDLGADNVIVPFDVDEEDRWGSAS